MDRALLVGINAYPGAALSGCVNDVESMSQVLNEHCGFAKDDIRWLVDARATTDAIRERLQWLVKGVVRGDRVVFHYSGHGAQVATRSKITAEVDGLDEVICPVDFDWTDNHLIRDKELRDIFSVVPPGVHFVWICDCCHAGDLDRDFPSPVIGSSISRRRRTLPPPPDIAWRIATAHEKGMTSIFARSMAMLNVAFVAACRSDELASDTVIDGVPCGALTHYFVERLLQSDGLSMPLTTIIDDVTRRLAANQYNQHPQLDGPTENISEAYMAQRTLLPSTAPVVSPTLLAAPQLSAARPNGHVIDQSVMVQGDIVLYRGDDWTARALALFDRSDVSSAAVYDGEGFVIETHTNGVRKHAIGETLAGQDGVLVRRFSSTMESQNLLQRANEFLAKREHKPYDPVVQVALLAIARKILPTAVLPTLLKKILDSAITAVLVQNGRSEPAKSQTSVEVLKSIFIYSPSLTVKDASKKPTKQHPYPKIQHGSVLDSLRHLTDEQNVSGSQITAPNLDTIESLWARYEGEVARSMSPITIEEVAAAVTDDVNRFAFALLRVSQGPTAKLTLRPALKVLFEVANNFLTPGDLVRNHSLIDIGYLKRVPRATGVPGHYAEAWRNAKLGD